MQEEIKKIVINTGWEEMPSKVDYMMSFHKGNIIRLNIYSSGTVTFQNMMKKYDKGETYRNCDLKKLHELLDEWG
jgi:hypothetical protein